MAESYSYNNYAQSAVVSESRPQVSPYECFLRHFYNQVFKPGMTSEEVIRMAQARWKCMTASEAAPYVDIANNQRERFGIEMPAAGVTISTAESSGRKRKRGKSIKDPNAPKRATTAFFYFAHEERPKVREANPDFKVTDISKELGERWRAMDDEQKKRFQDMADKDRQRYRDEMKVFTDTTNKGGNAGNEDAEED